MPDISGVSAIAQYGAVGIAVLLVFVIVWLITIQMKLIKDYNDKMDARDARIQGLSESTLAVVQSNNEMVQANTKIIYNHIEHNTAQMKENSVVMSDVKNSLNNQAESSREMSGTLNQLVGYLKSKNT